MYLVDVGPSDHADDVDGDACSLEYLYGVEDVPDVFGER